MRSPRYSSFEPNGHGNGSWICGGMASTFRIISHGTPPPYHSVVTMRRNDGIYLELPTEWTEGDRFSQSWKLDSC